MNEEPLTIEELSRARNLEGWGGMRWSPELAEFYETGPSPWLWLGPVGGES